MRLRVRVRIMGRVSRGRRVPLLLRLPLLWRAGACMWRRRPGCMLLVVVRLLLLRREIVARVQVRTGKSTRPGRRALARLVGRMGCVL